MQNNEPERPRYPFPPFGTRETLAKMLALSIDQLDQLEQNSDSLYDVVEKRKKSGEPRICYDARPTLKKVQGRIKVAILRQVIYPSYLTGGLPRRDYLENAQRHQSPRVMMNDDIEDFFPTISSA